MRKCRNQVTIQKELQKCFTETDIFHVIFFPCNFPLENKISWFFNLKYSCFLSLPLQSPSKWENLEMGHERGKPVVH